MKKENQNRTYLVKVQVVAEQVVSVKECSTMFDAEFMAVEKVKKEIEFSDTTSNGKVFNRKNG